MSLSECHYLNVIMPNVIMPNVIMPNVIMLSVIMLSVIMLNVIMLNVIMLNVIMPNVYMYKCIFAECHYVIFTLVKRTKEKVIIEANNITKLFSLRMDHYKAIHSGKLWPHSKILD